MMFIRKEAGDKHDYLNALSLKISVCNSKKTCGPQPNIKDEKLMPSF